MVPAFMARTVIGMSPWPVMKMIGIRTSPLSSSCCRSSPLTVSSPSTIPLGLASGRTRRPTWEPLPERWFLAQEARRHLQSAIAVLPEHQRLVLILRDVDGCSTEEVCNALGFQ